MLKEIPTNLKTISFLCSVIIEWMPLNLEGIVHFNQNKLRCVLCDFVLESGDISDTTLLIKIAIIGWLK